MKFTHNSQIHCVSDVVNLVMKSILKSLRASYKETYDLPDILKGPSIRTGPTTTRSAVMPINSKL